MTTEGIEQPEDTIADAKASHKYFGVSQANDNHKEAARKSATTK